MFGTWLAEIEATPRDDDEGPSFLERIRGLPKFKKAFVHLALSLVFLIRVSDPFHRFFDKNDHLRWIYYHFAHVSLVLICLTSPFAQKILLLPPI